MAGTATVAAVSTRPHTKSAVLIICVATLLSISVWFSASFVIKGISAQWQVPDSQLFWVTFGVQAGFILGAIASALLRLPDRLSARVLYSSCAAGAATANLLLLMFPTFEAALALRLATGVFLAGIYPVAVRETLAWVSPGRRGFASSTLLAALTIGSAAPHLINGVGSADWRVVIIATSICSVVGGLMFLLVPGTAPYRDTGTRVSLRQGLAVLRNRKVLLVNLAYFSHMWELYAMWTFVGALFAHRISGGAAPTGLVAVASFIIIASGALGCIAAGLLADRFGKIIISQMFMLLSGAAATLVAISATWGPAVLLSLCILWGMTVIGESALLSALLRDHCPEAHVGSALSVQMAGGYAISAGSIALFPLLAGALSWELAVLALVLGPVVGITLLQLLKSGPRPQRGNRTESATSGKFASCP
ncbi:MFS transporter [Arthrobacter sp. S39]|uniref:MFS transporter n=1 Tax=Arthrobacter sp. S39 TaxID=2509720 RepID=UPI001037B696|nr:MFS transporter [Arthrobacter sp. S39]TAP44923.1 MFS transporter [Arthrobacter sp. S39]